jgi:hypothetical protein
MTTAIESYYECGIRSLACLLRELSPNRQVSHSPRLALLGAQQIRVGKLENVAVGSLAKEGPDAHKSRDAKGRERLPKQGP